MDDLSDFLRQRNVPEETIKTLEHDKIDASTIQLMTNEELKTYLPSYGDRLAVLGFCRQKENSQNKSRKTKLAKRKPCDEGGSSSTKQGEHSQPTKKRNALKTKRKIEIGWMHYDEEKEVFKQVRAKRGGGTRKVDISKDAQKKDLIKEATGLFFPNGRNSQGPLTDFEMDLTDYQEVTVDDVATVGQLYSDTKLPLLRFYLTTQKRKNDSPHSQSKVVSTSLERQETSQNKSSNSLVSDATHSPTAILETVTSEDLFLRRTTSNDFSLHLKEDRNVTEEENKDVFESSNIIDFFYNETLNLGDTLLLSPQPMPSSERVRRPSFVHRGQVLPELIACFCDDGRKNFDNIENIAVRDYLSEFWNEFYEHCTTGNAFKVPLLRHDFGQQQWESVGRIIAFGWVREKYLPDKIAPVILEQAILGYVKSDVVENFLKYMDESDLTVIKSCQSDFDRIDQEELIDILDNYSCKTTPTASNIDEILQQLAHKTLVQEPAYVIEQWNKVLGTTRFVQDLKNDLISFRNIF